jgi:tryptophan synthase beta chain
MYISIQSKFDHMHNKIVLDESEMPKRWYNIQADLPSPLDPPLNPQTKKPATPDDMHVIFPMELIMQEVSTQRFIDIPQEVADILRIWRPSPLYRESYLSGGC